MKETTSHTALPWYSDEGDEALRRIRKLARSQEKYPRPLNLRLEFEERGIPVTNATLKAFMEIRHGNLDKQAVSSGRVAAAYNLLLPHTKKLISDWHDTVDPAEIVGAAVRGCWKGLRQFPTNVPVEEVSPYLLACIDHELVDTVRQHLGTRLLREINHRAERGEETADLFSVSYDEYDRPSDDWTDSRILLLDLDRMIRESRHGKAFLLHLAGYTDKEIADSLDLNVESVKQRRKDLRRRLRAYLNE